MNSIQTLIQRGATGRFREPCKSSISAILSTLSKRFLLEFSSDDSKADSAAKNALWISSKLHFKIRHTTIL